ncbi:hypothetical protein GCK72_022593 [Caenorhabditis remanei]|uniref:Uncharacterized protein n=1 Tax=Caenorhabditis remanei TaxID=31234 RepID=A0A6A5FU43_CAERE|nr:hypothetical protein GCK72_022593 [Caenorhabditis remanei]KAF1746140.1 hypothetical protein GCK72_022593 [Caenorhabditis remanei]
MNGTLSYQAAIDSNIKYTFDDNCSACSTWEESAKPEHFDGVQYRICEIAKSPGKAVSHKIQLLPASWSQLINSTNYADPNIDRIA